MEIKLKRPLVFFDIESTGLDISTDRIIEISFVKLYPDGHTDIKTRRINPGMHIPEASTAIHHITDEDVKDCPYFKQYAKSLAQQLEGCDIAGYNSIKFDIPLLAEEFLRCGIDFDFSRHRLVDVQNIYHKMEPRTLAAAYKFYCHKELEGAHGAETDTIATMEVLKAQLEKYSDTLENDVDALADFSVKNRNIDLAGAIILNDKGEAVFGFGKYKDKSVVDTLREDPGYYSWMEGGKFTEYTKRILSDIRVHPEKYKK